jgi:hypothetical protein
MIKDDAFTGCSSLRVVVLPESITTVNATAFNECRCLDAVVKFTRPEGESPEIKDSNPNLEDRKPQTVRAAKVDVIVTADWVRLRTYWWDINFRKRPDRNRTLGISIPSQSRETLEAIRTILLVGQRRREKVSIDANTIAMSKGLFELPHLPIELERFILQFLRVAETGRKTGAETGDDHTV